MREDYLKLYEISRNLTPPSPLPAPCYQRKFPKVPVLEDYRGKFSESFWENFPTNRKTDPASWVNADALDQLAIKLDYPRGPRFMRVLETLRSGARMGVGDDGRVLWEGSNYPSSYTYGHLLSDTLADWLHEGVVSGPWLPDEVDSLIPVKRIHPMSVQLKSSGAARIIIDMSAPRNQHIKSINSTINGDDFPVSMCNSGTVLEKITNAGFGCSVRGSKCDWVHAYKQVPVCPDDASLQYCSWGGKLFVDLSLVFGASSSPSIFDDLAACVLELSVLEAVVSAADTGHQLDDAFFIGPEDQAWRWFTAYRRICSEIGVKLADLSKPDKMQPPSQEITLLGLEYDLKLWRWRMPLEKSNKLLVDLHNLFMMDVAPMKLATKVCGKVTHYGDVVGGVMGKYERSFLIYLTEEQETKEEVKVDKNVRSQLGWWLRRVVFGEAWSPLVDLRLSMPIQATRIFTDAAGGSPGSYNGFGGVVFGYDLVYFQAVWPDFIQMNTPWDGVQFGSKLTFLELIAILGGVLAAPKGISNGSVILTTDNIGAYYGALRGHSRDRYSYTMVKALAEICQGLAINWKVEFLPRRVGLGPCLADELSKGRVQEALRMLQEEGLPGPYKYANLSRSFLAFISRPRATRVLGTAILKELATYMEVALVSPEWEEEFADLVVHSVCDLEMY